MSNLNLKKFSFLLFFLIIFSFYFFDIDNIFTIQFLKENHTLVLEYINENYFYSIIFFYLLFLILLFFFLPVASIMVIFSSYLFGALTTIFLSIVTITLGGVSNVFLLKKLTFARIFNKAKYYAEIIKNKIKENEMQYLIMLRFIPMPFIIQNAILTLLNTSRFKFIISTILGILPWMIIYSLAGYKLRELINLNNEIGIEDIINYENFSIIALLIFLSIYLKKKIK